MIKTHTVLNKEKWQTNFLNFFIPPVTSSFLIQNTLCNAVLKHSLFLFFSVDIYLSLHPLKDWGKLCC